MKKGFTLVEIILSIALITVIGVGFTIGFVAFRKHSNASKLDEMSSEIYTAVHLLIETDEETKKQLYTNKNGVVVPLTKLESEGLIDFQGLNIEDEAVVTVLGSDTNSGACSGSLYDVSTWTKASGDVIYICGNSGQNLISVGGVADNLSKAEREVYYFRGVDPNNYAQINGEGDKYRILSIDIDDSIVLSHTSSFPSISNLAKNTCYNSVHLDAMCLDNNTALPETTPTKTESAKECSISTYDVINTTTCTKQIITTGKLNYFSITSPFGYSWLGAVNTSYKGEEHYNSAGNISYIDNIHYLRVNTNTSITNQKTIHLQSCWKIKGGTGNFATPFILKNEC